MTMTDLSAAPAVVLTPPTHHQVILAICEETGCDRTDAEEVLHFLFAVRNFVRGLNYEKEHFLTDYQLRVVHPILDKFMRDDRQPIYGDGSAFDLANRFVLDFERGEISFLHSKTNGILRFCFVNVAVAKVS